MKTRLQPLHPSKRCGLPECWCTPPEPAKKDYGTRPAEPGERMVPRGIESKKKKTYTIEERF